MDKGENSVFLVLGGMGFIGRNLVDYLIRNEKAKKVIAVDKKIPQMAWLSKKHKESFKKVFFEQANLIKPQSISGVFDKHPDIEYVINCAGETKPGQAAEVYEEGIYQLSTTCAQESNRRGVKCYVEVSNGQLLKLQKNMDSTDGLSLSDGKLQWMQTSYQKLRVERALAQMSGLRHVVARTAVVYGDGDSWGLTPYLIFAGVCKYIDEPLQMLWDKNHAYSTVHVDDVARALVHLCMHAAAGGADDDDGGTVYYLADKSCTTQGSLAKHLSSIFGIKTSFLGNIITTFAKMQVGEVMREVTEEHLTPWVEVCEKEGILTTPLYPALTEDVFNDKACQIDGSLIEEMTGFQYLHPLLTQQHLTSLLHYHIDLKLFPASLFSNSLSHSSTSSSSSSSLAL